VEGGRVYATALATLALLADGLFDAPADASADTSR
jgi:hypothetical protein